MDYNDIIKTLQDMESRFVYGFSNLDRAFLDKIYYELFGREITNKGCSDCYRDAYIEIKIKLKKDKTMPKKSDYKLKAGAVITFFGQSKAYTSANLTNEVAEKYLALNPSNANMFAELPDDWKARVAAYVKRSAAPSTTAPHMTEEDTLNIITAKDAEIDEKDALLAERDAHIAELEKQLNTPVDAQDNPSEKDLEVENLRMELGTANEQLAATTEERDKLQTEVENLKKENKSLRQSNTMLKKKADVEASVEGKPE